MRIAYLTCVYPPYPGGIGVLAEGMANEMARRGHGVHVFTPKQQNYTLHATHYTLHELWPWIRFGNAAFLPQLLWRLKGFDVVHVLYPFYGVAELVPFFRFFTKAQIVMHHTMDAVDTGWRGKVFKLHSKYIMPPIFRAAHRVVALSEDYWRNCELEKLGLKNVDIVPNGVDTDRFRPKSMDASHGSQLGLRSQVNSQLQSLEPITKLEAQTENHTPTILFVGGLDRAHYFKGVPVLLEACRILCGRGVKFRCQIVGDGDMREEYEKQAKDSPFAEGLSLAEFVGLVPHEQLPDYYQRATVAVVPSTQRIECFSIVAAEAQACGIPAIVTDFPGVRVTIEDGVTGFVVRPGDTSDLAEKLAAVLKDPTRAQMMGKKGRERVERLYSWKIVGDKLQHMYEDLYY